MDAFSKVCGETMGSVHSHVTRCPNRDGVSKGCMSLKIQKQLVPCKSGGVAGFCHAGAVARVQTWQWRLQEKVGGSALYSIGRWRMANGGKGVQLR